MKHALSLLKKKDTSCGLMSKGRCPEEEKSLCKSRIADISKELKELRHELKLVKDIEARSPAMEEKLKEIEKERNKEVQR